MNLGRLIGNYSVNEKFIDEVIENTYKLCKTKTYTTINGEVGSYITEINGYNPHSSNLFALMYDHRKIISKDDNVEFYGYTLTSPKMEIVKQVKTVKEFWGTRISSEGAKLDIAFQISLDNINKLKSLKENVDSDSFRDIVFAIFCTQVGFSQAEASWRKEKFLNLSDLEYLDLAVKVSNEYKIRDISFHHYVNYCVKQFRKTNDVYFLLKACSFYKRNGFMAKYFPKIKFFKYYLLNKFT